MQLRYSVTCVTASMKSWEPTVNNQPFFLRSYTRRTASTQRSGPISRRPAWRAIRPGRQAATAALPCAARPRPFWLHSLRPSSAVARPAVRVLHAVHGDGPVPALEARRARSNSTRSKPSLARSAAVSELGCNDCNPLYRARAAFRREWGPQPGRQRRQPRARMRQGPWRRTLVHRRAFSGRAGVAADRGHGGRAAARPRDSNPVRAQQPVSGGNGAPGRRTARQHGAAPAGRAAALGMSIIDGQGPHRIFSHPAAGRAGLRRRAGYPGWRGPVRVDRHGPARLGPNGTLIIHTPRFFIIDFSFIYPRRTTPPRVVCRSSRTRPAHSQIHV